MEIVSPTHVYVGRLSMDVGCMDSPAAEAPQDNNVTAIWTTSCGEQLNGHRPGA